MDSKPKETQKPTPVAETKKEEDPNKVIVDTFRGWLREGAIIKRKEGCNEVLKINEDGTIIGNLYIDMSGDLKNLRLFGNDKVVGKKDRT